METCELNDGLGRRLRFFTKPNYSKPRYKDLGYNEYPGLVRYK
jgi:hypothetical protein